MSARLVAALAVACSTSLLAGSAPAWAGTATAQMRVSVTVVEAPKRHASPSAAAEMVAVGADAPIAVVTDSARGTQLIIY